jgi:hypothetical protein
MAKSPCLIILLLGAARIGWAQQVESVRVGNFIPAGTLLGCTLDEPNFSSQTARPEDPVICKTRSVEMFGRTVIPRGAYLAARLRGYRDPGHFVGKGWLQLEFTSLTLPGGTVPLDAKVISAARYRVNGDGKIQGRGHPRRDAVEWAIPILWPIKVLTLPARGPRPALKGETRIELRLMEDLVIPDAAYMGAGGLTQRSSAARPKPGDNGITLAASQFANFRSDNPGPPTRPAASASVERRESTPAVNRAPAAPQGRLTLLVFRDGRMYLAADYWVNKGNLDYTSGGALHAIPLGVLDEPMTRRLNAERGVSFVLAVR